MARHHPDVRTQHAIGALVGATVGDALGAPFEFREPGLYTHEFPSPVLGEFGEMHGGGSLGWGPAEFTDDTQMAVALAESLVDRGGLDCDDVWTRWQTWERSAKDVGVLTRVALAGHDHAGAAERAQARNGGKSAGNGTIMRNTPIALFGLDQPIDATRTLAVDQSALTHLDPHCGWAAAIHATLVRAGIDGDDMFAAIDDSLSWLPQDAQERWQTLLDPNWVPASAEFTNGTVWTCLAQAVWAVRASQSFEEAVVRAVDLGDDADTVGCVAGSLAGTRWGIQAIPSRWTTYLNGRLSTPNGEARYDYAGLQDLARRLIGKNPVPLAVPEPAAGPTRVHEDLPVYAADWKGAATAPTDWAVVSLCRTENDFVQHPVRRNVYLIDQYDETDNADIVAALRDTVDTIDAFLTEAPKRPIVVHCHGGRSRTAFLLEAWAMRRHGWNEEQAHDWLTRTWDRAHRENPVFARILAERWPPS